MDLAVLLYVCITNTMCIHILYTIHTVYAYREVCCILLYTHTYVYCIHTIYMSRYAVYDFVLFSCSAQGKCPGFWVVPKGSPAVILRASPLSPTLRNRNCHIWISFQNRFSTLLELYVDFMSAIQLQYRRFSNLCNSFRPEADSKFGLALRLRDVKEGWGECAGHKHRSCPKDPSVLSGPKGVVIKGVSTTGLLLPDGCPALVKPNSPSVAQRCRTANVYFRSASRQCKKG